MRDSTSKTKVKVLGRYLRAMAALAEDLGSVTYMVAHNILKLLFQGI